MLKLQFKHLAPFARAQKILNFFPKKGLTIPNFCAIIRVQKRKEMIIMNTKFFKTVDVTGFYSLYACHADTPIPTMKEIVERDHLNPFCEEDVVVEISMEEFLQLHNETLANIADSANDMVEWSPNGGAIKSWEWWFSAEEWEEMEG